VIQRAAVAKWIAVYYDEISCCFPGQLIQSPLNERHLSVIMLELPNFSEMENWSGSDKPYSIQFRLYQETRKPRVGRAAVSDVPQGGQFVAV